MNDYGFIVARKPPAGGYDWAGPEEAVIYLLWSRNLLIDFTFQYPVLLEPMRSMMSFSFIDLIALSMVPFPMSREIISIFL